MRFGILIIGLLLLTSSCKKVAGEGGSSTIIGKINIKNYNSAGTLVGEYDGAKEDVYIVYGDEDNTFDDKIEASFDGSFAFKYLEKGTYTVFAYQDCITCDSGEEVVKTTVTISDKKSTVDAGTIDLKK